MTPVVKPTTAESPLLPAHRGLRIQVANTQMSSHGANIERELRAISQRLTPTALVYRGSPKRAIARHAVISNSQKINKKMYAPSSLRNRELPTISRNSQKIKKILDNHTVMEEVAEANKIAGDAYLAAGSFDHTNFGSRLA